VLFRIVVPASLVACATTLQAADLQAHETLETVIVTGTPLATTPLVAAQPVGVLTGEDLHRRARASLGETLATEPGVSSTYFGPIASRPIIRGASGYRVQMLEDGLGAMDASGLSDDHAVTLEPTLAQRIEVLRGPAVLLYGSNAAGGAVNVVSKHLPDELPGQSSNSLELRGDSSIDERAAIAQVSHMRNRWFLHAAGFQRQTDDVHIPGAQVSKALQSRLVGDAGIPGGSGRVPNSGSESWGGSAGVGYFGERGSVGFGYRHQSTDYELPTEESAFIAMKQDRIDVRGRWDVENAFVSAISLRAGYNDYTHTEYEAPRVPGTTFEIEAHEVRLSADHQLGDRWRGTIGVQNAHQDLAARGEEAFVPNTVTRTWGLFAFEQRSFGAWTLEGGVRLDRQTIAADDRADYAANAVSLALGTVWHFSEERTLAFNVTRTERHPQAAELYANGVHTALARVEIGDIDLGKERAYTVDVGVRHNSDRLSWSVGAFFNRYDDYIQAAPTGATDPEEALPVFVYSATGADIYGMEVEMQMPVAAIASGRLNVRLFGDYLRGERRDGEPLPAMPPVRIGAGLDFDRDVLHLGFSIRHAAKQDRVTAAELPTAGYTLVSLDASYRWNLARGSLFAFLQGDNLLNAEAREHTSPLKDIVPLPGRGVRAGLRVEF
jgi:iron complex outermembrane receptor protein